MSGGGKNEMTECEICGVEIKKGHARYIQIGTSKLRVCEACARYGTAVVEPEKKNSSSLLARKRNLHHKEMDIEIEELDMDMDDYGRKVKEAREKAGLKQEELAKMINEKHSLLRKIENNAITPTEEVRMKIERVLKPYL